MAHIIVNIVAAVGKNLPFFNISDILNLASRDLFGDLHALWSPSLLQRNGGPMAMNRSPLPLISDLSPKSERRLRPLPAPSAEVSHGAGKRRLPASRARGPRGGAALSPAGVTRADGRFHL